jgi:hypothetical protein
MVQEAAFAQNFHENKLGKKQNRVKKKEAKWSRLKGLLSNTGWSSFSPVTGQ